MESKLGFSEKEDQIAKLKKQFQEELSKLRLEVEKLRSIYPLYDLLVFKQTEIERLTKAFNLISQEHPEYFKLESIIADHFEELEALKSLIEKMEIRFNRFLDQIHVAEIRTFDLSSNLNCLDEKRETNEAPFLVPEF